MDSENDAGSQTFGEWLRQFFSGGRAYRSSDGRTVLVMTVHVREDAVVSFLSDHIFLHDPLLGTTFQQVRVTGYISRKNMVCWNCEHSDGRRFVVSQTEMNAFILEPEVPVARGRLRGFDPLRLLENSEWGPIGSTAFALLPDIQVPERLFLHPDGRAFYVDAPKYDDGRLDRFRCFVGKPGAMTQVTVTDVTHVVVNGDVATVIYTDAGVLFSPAKVAMREGAKSYFIPELEDVTSFNAIVREQISGQVELREIPCHGNDAVRLIMGWILPT